MSGLLLEASLCSQEAVFLTTLELSPKPWTKLKQAFAGGGGRITQVITVIRTFGIPRWRRAKGSAC